MMYNVYVKSFLTKYNPETGRYENTGEEGYPIALREISAKSPEQAFDRYCDIIKKDVHRMHSEARAAVLAAIERGDVTVKMS